MGKKERLKGAAYERYVAKLFKSIGFKDAKRHLESQPSESGFGRDLDGTQPYAIQCKCWKATPSISALDEIIPSEEYPVRVAVLKRTQHKGKKGLEVAVVDLKVFLNMVELLLDYKSVVEENYGPIGSLAEELLREE